jgi:hypothetical protein
VKVTQEVSKMATSTATISQPAESTGQGYKDWSRTARRLANSRLTPAQERTVAAIAISYTRRIWAATTGQS